MRRLTLTFNQLERRITVDAIELTVEEELKQSDLAQKLKKGEITIAETHELRNLLEKEKHIISRQGNCLANSFGHISNKLCRRIS
jgi:hypothetical protein